MCAGVLPGLQPPLQSCCLVCAHHGRHAEVALRTIAVVPCLQILLEKGVKEDKILFLSLIAAPEGIHKICAEVRQPGSALLAIPGKDVDARGIAAGLCRDPGTACQPLLPQAAGRKAPKLACCDVVPKGPGHHQ